MNEYRCAQAVLEVENDRYSLYYPIESQSFDRNDLLKLIAREELLALATRIGARVIGFTIETRRELSSGGHNRLIEIIDKSSFDSELVPRAHHLEQPKHHFDISGDSISLTKDCQQYFEGETWKEKDTPRRGIVVTRQYSSKTLKI